MAIECILILIDAGFISSTTREFPKIRRQKQPSFTTVMKGSMRHKRCKPHQSKDCKMWRCSTTPWGVSYCRRLIHKSWFFESARVYGAILVALPSDCRRLHTKSWSRLAATFFMPSLLCCSICSCSILNPLSSYTEDPHQKDPQCMETALRPSCNMALGPRARPRPGRPPTGPAATTPAAMGYMHD